MQRREFWERQFKVFLCKFTPKTVFYRKIVWTELTVNHLTGFYYSIFTVFLPLKITVIFYSVF